MSDQVNGLSGKVGLDTTDYKSGVAELARQVRVIESGFRATAATMGDWDKSAKGLEERNKSLTQIMDLQEKKVIALRNEYARIVAEKGEDSRAAEEMLIKVNKETEALNRSRQEVEQNTTKLDGMKTGVKNLGNEEEVAERKTISFKQVLSGIGSVLAGAGKAIAAVATAAATAIGSIVGGVLKMASSADEIAESAEKAGISAEKYQELDYVGKQLGVDIGTLTGSWNKLKISQEAAKKEGSEQFKIFKALGVDAIDPLTGKLRDSQTVFDETLAVLKKYPDPVEADAFAMKLLGKSADELKPLINASSGELQKLTDEAHQNGAVMSDEAVKGLSDFQDSLDGLKMGLKGTLGEMAASMMPFANNVMSGLQGYMQAISQVVKGSNGDIGKIGSGLGEILGRMFSSLAGQLPGIMNAGLNIVKGLVSAIIASLPTLIPAVIQIIQSIVTFLISMVNLLMPAVVQLLLGLVALIVTNLPMIVEAALQIVIALVQGISQALPTLIPAIVGVVLSIVDTLINNLPMLIMAALQLIMALAQGLLAALPNLISKIPTIITSLVTGLIQHLPEIILAGLQIILALALGIVQNIPSLIAILPNLINQLVAKFKSPEFKNSMKTAGTALVDGLKQGWDDMWTNFKKHITDGFNSMVASIKSLLGIASPSKVAYGIMYDGWGAGQIGGVKASFKTLRQTILGEMSDMVNLYANGLGGSGGMALAGAGGSTNNNQQSYNFYGPVTLAGNAGDSLGKTIQERRY